MKEWLEARNILAVHPIPRPILDHPPRRIAIFRALQLGDLLVAVPAFRSIRSGFPEAEITLIGLPWAAAFARRFHRYIDRFVEFPGYPGIVEAEADPERTERFLKEQRSYGYDLAIQMHGSGVTSNRFVLALGARVTAGPYEGDRPSSLTLSMPYPADEPEVLRNLAVARLLGCPDEGTQLEYPLFDDDRAAAATLLREVSLASGPLTGLHVGARSPARRWPAEYFATVADTLVQRHGAQIVLTGGPDDEPVVRTVMERMETNAVSVAGKTTRGSLAALIAELDLFISNDTGPAHVAEAIGTPSITIFGPVDPKRWAPLDQEVHRIVRRKVACSPCPHWECPIDHRCLRWLKPRVVLDAAADLLPAGAIACNA